MVKIRKKFEKWRPSWGGSRLSWGILRLDIVSCFDWNYVSYNPKARIAFSDIFCILVWAEKLSLWSHDVLNKAVLLVASMTINWLAGCRAWYMSSTRNRLICLWFRTWKRVWKRVTLAHYRTGLATTLLWGSVAWGLTESLLMYHLKIVNKNNCHNQPSSVLGCLQRTSF
jgi:hypothetical protein